MSARIACVLATPMGSITLSAGPPVVPVIPSQVVNPRALLRAHTHRQDFYFYWLAESNGRWAALATFESTKNSMVVVAGSDEAPRFSDYIDGSADRIAMDPSGQIYLHIRNTREIEIRDAALGLISRHKYRLPFEPVPSGVGVFSTDGFSVHRLFRLGPDFIRQAGAIGGAPEVPFDVSTPDYGTIVALPNGTAFPDWIRIKTIVEEVAVFDNKGALLAHNTMELDDAYTAFGYQIPQRYPAVESVRVGWVLTSRKGELYVRLSSVPIDRPIPIAVLDPMSGHVLRVLSLVLPTSPDRVGKYNPQGFMDDSRIAMNDQKFAVLDGKVGLLPIYTSF